MYYIIPIQSPKRRRYLYLTPGRFTVSPRKYGFIPLKPEKHNNNNIVSRIIISHNNTVRLCIPAATRLPAVVFIVVVIVLFSVNTAIVQVPTTTYTAGCRADGPTAFPNFVCDRIRKFRPNQIFKARATVRPFPFPRRPFAAAGTASLCGTRPPGPTIT